MRVLTIALLALTLAFGGRSFAQTDALSVSDVNITAREDAFGVVQQFVDATLTNASDAAYADVQIFAEVYDADETLIGEGYGFLTDQCGTAVPFDFVLRPQADQHFQMTLELFEDGEIDAVEFFPQGRVLDDVPPAPEETPIDGIVPVNRRDIAAIEWIVPASAEDAATPAPDAPAAAPQLLYGEGCYRDVFTRYKWRLYDPQTDTSTATEHPRYAEATNPALWERMSLASQYVEDSFERLFNRSGLAFPPNNGTRIIFQTDNNTLVSTQIDGTFRRIIDEQLFRSTLQGIQWLPDERFLAYYYGAYGDGVTYLLASTAGAYFSTPERFSVPSVTVPTATPDLSNVIISGAFVDDVRGFYLKPPAAERYALLFAYENLPGNNYPAPVYVSRGGVQAEDVIYFALPDDDNAPRLFCYDRREAQLFDLAPLPFQLDTADRAHMRLSPDGATIALGASGVNGGLWLLQREQFAHCND